MNDSTNKTQNIKNISNTSNTSNASNASNIFSKLKRKPETTSILNDNNSNIENDLKLIKENQEQIKNTCNQILEILQNKIIV